MDRKLFEEKTGPRECCVGSICALLLRIICGSGWQVARGRSMAPARRGGRRVSCVCVGLNLPTSHHVPQGRAALPDPLSSRREPRQGHSHLQTSERHWAPSSKGDLLRVRRRTHARLLQHPRSSRAL